MKASYFGSVLDACVLAPMPVCETLLRLAEHDPPFYSPLWSAHILEEVFRTLKKFGYSEGQAKRRIKVMETAFPEAMVTGYEGPIPAVGVHTKDRHVLAAAVRARADCIVSNNVKHFPRRALQPFELECLTGEDFLLHQYHLDPESFIAILNEQAEATNRPLAGLMALLSSHAPKLADLIKA